MSSPTQAPARQTDEVFCIHSTLTTDLQQVVAPSEWSAFAEWLDWHSIEGQNAYGQMTSDGFRHLEIGLETAGELHVVYVVAENVLDGDDLKIGPGGGSS